MTQWFNNVELDLDPVFIVEVDPAVGVRVTAKQGRSYRSLLSKLCAGKVGVWECHISAQWECEFSKLVGVCTK